MKHCTIFAIILIFPFCTGMADNNIAIGLKNISSGCPLAHMPVLWENDVLVKGVCNGFIISADTGLTVWFEEGAEYVDPANRGGLFLPWYFHYYSSVGDSLHPDKVFIGLMYMPPVNVIPPGSLEPFYHLFLNVDGLYGNIYVDSIAEPPSYDWVWDDGVQNLHPTFNYDGSTHVIYYGYYICGDANDDAQINISDAVHLLGYIFVGGMPPIIPPSGDANCDSSVNISDVVWIINYVFSGGYAPCDTNGDGEPDC